MAFVHQATEEQAKPFFTRYGLADVNRISDPGCRLYRAFALRRASLGDVVNRFVLRRGAEAARAGHHTGIPVGDISRMAGVFLIRDGQIVSAFRHRTVADRPDYGAIARCESGACEVMPGTGP